MSYILHIFYFIVILLLLFEINAFVGAYSNLPVRSAVAFGRPRIFVTVTMSLPLIGRKHKDTQSSPRSSASILKFKRKNIWLFESHFKRFTVIFLSILVKFIRTLISQNTLIIIVVLPLVFFFSFLLYFCW